MSRFSGEFRHEYKRISGIVFLLLAPMFIGCSMSEAKPCSDVDCGPYGVCVLTDDGAQCLCEPGYIELLGSCVADPCRGPVCVHGTCRADRFGQAVCDCAVGYVGLRCDSCAPDYKVEGLRCVPGSPCEYDPCVYGACRNEGGMALCDCFWGYGGEYCSSCAEGFYASDLKCLPKTPCQPDPCVYGLCEPVGESGFECICEPGATGDLCDECAPGYREQGLRCVPISSGPCNPNPCTVENRTLCHAIDGEAVCRCDEGYYDTGDDCVEATACLPNPCDETNRSQCREDGEGRYFCLCDPGYHQQGGVCVPSGVCDPNPCTTVNRTVCKEEDGEPLCLCDQGYHLEGDDCVRTTLCRPNPCDEPNRTRCVPDGGEYFCLCDPGYHEELGECVLDVVCDPETTCSGRGQCTGNELECLCDPGYAGVYCEICVSGYYLDDDGLCVPGSVCEPNPCRTVNRTLCQETADGYECLCDSGYQDGAGDGVCRPDCTTTDLDCGPMGECVIRNGYAVCSCEEGHRGSECRHCEPGYQDNDQDGICFPDCDHGSVDCGSLACDDSSGVALCSGVRSCLTRVVYDPEGRQHGSVYIAGEFNNWDLSLPMDWNQTKGVYTILLDLDPGDYAYKLVDRQEDDWFENPSSPYYIFDESGWRNSRLHVEDCLDPILELVGEPVVTADSISFQVLYVDGAGADGLNPASVTATKNHQTITGSFDSDTGIFTVSKQGLSNGKYTFRFRAADQNGRKSKLLYLPFWIEDEPFRWEDAVLYFAMTDRFRDGDHGNNDPHPNVDQRANWQGGDFAGLKWAIENDYFSDLGVNALWISSIAQNTSKAGEGIDDDRMYTAYHSYWPVSTGWTDDNHLEGVVDVEPRFGTMQEFRGLVEAAHQRGIRVLLDFVANHVHKDSPLWQQYQHSNPPWFSLVNGQPYVCGWDKPIECWFTDYLPSFNFKNIDALHSVIEHAVWMATSTGIDGYRVDAVKHFDDEVTFALRARIEESVNATGHGHRFYLVGETFTGDDDSAFGQLGRYVEPRMLDGQFDFPLFWDLVRVFLREEQDLSRMEGFLQQNDGRYGDYAIMSNFLGNHDVARALSHASGDIDNIWGDGSKEQGWSNPPQLPNWELPYQRLRMAWTLVMTIPGVPLIYYGDEFGMAGAGDPDNRRFMQWGNYNSHQLSTLDHVQKLSAARASNKAFRYGQREALFMAGDNLFWAFGLRYEGEKALVVFNRTTGSRTHEIPLGWLGLSEGALLTDVLGGSTITVSNDSVSVTLGARTSAVFVP